MPTWFKTSAPASMRANMTSRSETQIDLFMGWPNPGLLPASSLRRGSAVALSDPDIYVPGLGYGPDEGYGPLRETLAAWTNRFYEPQTQISKDRICITGGASQNLACLLQTFSDPLYTRNIWMVSPTYYLACRIFDDAGFAGKLRGVPEDDQGVNLDFLEGQLQESESRAEKERNLQPVVKQPRPWRKIYKHIIYAVPTFANPSGGLMSLNRRQALIRLARKYDALCITDDVYDMLQWPATPALGARGLDKAYLPRLVDVDRYLDGGPVDPYGNSVSNCSFSKIVGPGCRTGWAEGTEKLVYGLSQTGSSRSGGCPSHVTATFIHQLLMDSTLSKHIHTVLQPKYARRYHNMMNALHEHVVPLGVTMPQADRDVAGGYFIWLTLPGGLDSDLITKKALDEEGLVIASGTAFRVQGDPASEGLFIHEIRLCFSWAEEDLIEEGIQRLARVIKRGIEEQ